MKCYNNYACIVDHLDEMVLCLKNQKLLKLTQEKKKDNPNGPITINYIELVIKILLKSKSSAQTVSLVNSTNQ